MDVATALDPPLVSAIFIHRVYCSIQLSVITRNNPVSTEFNFFLHKWQRSDHMCLIREELLYHKYIIKWVLQRLYLKFTSSWIYSNMEITKYFEGI